MRKKYLPANLSLEIPMSYIRAQFIEEMNGWLAQHYLSDEDVPSEEEVSKYFKDNFSRYRDDIRETAIEHVMASLDAIFPDDFFDEFVESVVAKADAQKPSVLKEAWSKVRANLTSEEIAALEEDIKSRQ